MQHSVLVDLILDLIDLVEVPKAVKILSDEDMYEVVLTTIAIVELIPELNAVKEEFIVEMFKKSILKQKVQIA